MDLEPWVCAYSLHRHEWIAARHELHVELEAVASDVVDLGGSQFR